MWTVLGYHQGSGLWPSASPLPRTLSSAPPPSPAGHSWAAAKHNTAAIRLVVPDTSFTESRVFDSLHFSSATIIKSYLLPGVEP